MKSPKVKRAQALRPSCLVETPLAKWWWHRRRNELRRCVVCGIAVKNEKLAADGLTVTYKDAAFAKLREISK